jgi:hypothetical protein
MKNMYEVFDEFEEAKTKKEKMDVIQKNLSPTLVKVLEYTFHPNYRWKVKDMPEEYKIPDTVPGISFGQLSTELRRIYLFQEGHPSAEALTDRKRKERLLQFLEGLEPREAEVVMGIMRKDLGVKGLTYKFVKECFPRMLP